MSKNKLKIIDLPGTDLQLHIHTDESGDFITGGSIKTYGGERIATLDNFQLAIADLYARELKLNTKDVTIRKRE